VDPAPLLSDLTPAQRRAVETEASSLCILAGAGSGKTRVLTRRIGYRLATGTADPNHVLALTFTRRAAGELGDRLAGLGLRQRLTAGTFHAVAYAQLRRYWADRGETPPQLLDRKSRLLARLVTGRPEVTGAPLSELAAEIEWASARLLSPEQYPAAAAAAGRRLPVTSEAMAALMARYQTEKVRRRLADFDDLLCRCALAIEQDPAFAAVQRWRWRHLFVDEFQDVNPLQYRLLTAWLGSQPDVCVVGDPNQAVYGWNGADTSLLARLPDRWPGTEVIHLDDNHRCTPQVVAAAAGVLGAAGAELRSSRADGPPAVVRAYPDDGSEAHGVVAELRARRASGLPWTQMAILVRTNAQVVSFEAACRAAQVPYRLAGVRPFLDDPEIQALLVDLGRRRAEPFEIMRADLAAAPNGAASSAGAAETLAALAGDFERWRAARRSTGS
jgi:DNA helicase-2/ATP-dependent DNA helicase PcrA